MPRYLCSITCNSCGHSASWEQDIPSDVYSMMMECLKCGFESNFVKFQDIVPVVNWGRMDRILGQLRAEDVGIKES